MAPLASFRLGPRNARGRWGGVSAIWNTAVKISGQENRLKKHLFLSQIFADIFRESS